MPKYHYDTFACKVIKLKPTYLLSDVKQLIREKRCELTAGAKKSANSIGFSPTQAKEFVSSLESKDFIRSATDNYNHKVWQDVYIKKYGEISLFIKFKIYKIDDQELLILSFKKNTND